MLQRNLAIFKTLTLKRVTNYLRLKVSYSFSNLLNKPIIWGKPMAVSIEPTTACNLRCPQCPSGLRKFTRPTGNLKSTLNQEILNKLGKQLQHINYYFQGEPFINPEFLELVKEARKRNIYVVTSTNAHFISEKIAEEICNSGINEVIISIDGTTQETYEKYRIEGQLQKVIEGTKILVTAKNKLKSKSPIITFQFLVTKYNEHQIPEIQKIKSDLGVDRLTLKTIQVYDFENGNDLIPTNDKYSRYKKSHLANFELKNKFKNSCWRTWSSAVITWDGSVVPCCFDKDAEHSFGKIQELGLNEVWKGNVRKAFYAKILKDRKSIEICKNCSEGSKVWA